MEKWKALSINDDDVLFMEGKKGKVDPIYNFNTFSDPKFSCPSSV
jgi:hypothetical protein